MNGASVKSASHKEALARPDKLVRALPDEGASEEGEE